MKDSRNSIWCAYLCKNKAASCVFMWVSKWDRVSPSGGHSLGRRQNHFLVSGHMIMQDDLLKKESFKVSREINHAYFSSGYAGAFPWKIAPMPCLHGKILNESVFWRHPEGDGVFLTGKATWEPSRQLCAIPATAPFRADCRIGESCLGKQDRLGLKHWFLVQVSQWNVNEKFSTSSCPDSPCQNLWSPRLGQRKSISGGHPARVAP